MKRTKVINWKTANLHPDERFWPLDYVNIQRPSRWGNRWSSKPSNVPGTVRVANPFQAVARYAHWILFDPHLFGGAPTVEEIRRELRGKVLVCGCVPAPCHGNPLVVIADSNEGDDLPYLLRPFLGNLGAL